MFFWPLTPNLYPDSDSPTPITQDPTKFQASMVNNSHIYIWCSFDPVANIPTHTQTIFFHMTLPTVEGIYSDPFNSKNVFFQNLINEVSRFVDKPNDQILQNILLLRDTENIEHLSRNIFKKKKYSSCFNSILIQNLFSLRRFILQKSFHFSQLSF
jgi:hypothetical protein